MALLKKDTSFQHLTMLIRSYGINSVKLAEILGCSQPTAMKKLTMPKFMTLEDVVNLSVVGGIPINKVKAVIR